ncbi:MAG: ComEA family DNA-binding protein [Clostridiales bacterium]|jgi:competence protein ComEA|nr:ComEA family DNA-binding protein [Clostridiales bacterium]
MLRISRREEVGALILAALLAVGLLFKYVILPQPAPEVVIERAEEMQAGVNEVVAEIVVHVSGAVRHPGVYRLKDGARVVDAVDAAGGIVPEGNADAINLAEPLYDGRKVTVPFIKQTETGNTGDTVDSRVNINEATAAQLETLPGIGPAKAAAIISYREANGPFRSVDDLAAVGGIGAKTVDALKELITLY